MVLSILAALMNATDHDPVKFVRDNYCKEAVETRSQIQYITKITQIEVTEKPSGFPIQYDHYSAGWGINGVFDEDEDEEVSELDFTDQDNFTADPNDTYFIREIKRRNRERIKQGID